MAHYAIGDIQGCFDEFQTLLSKIDFQFGKDTLWLCGDIINRGPKSLETLRFIMKHEDCIQMVLGNHDLHLLAIAYGNGRLKKLDTIQDILNATDNKIMFEWLRHQPLMLQEKQYLLVHAGLLPQWTAKQALNLAAEVENILSGTHYREFFLNMYGNKPARFYDDLRGMDRMRLIVNVMTRIRAITYDNKLNFDFKSTLNELPNDLIPWFQAAQRQHTDYTIIFGHWSALGLYMKDNVLGLDTGALWGGALTAINLHTHEVIQTQASCATHNI